MKVKHLISGLLLLSASLGFGQIPLVDGFDYPVDHKGYDANGYAVPLLETINPECNDNYPVAALANPSRGSTNTAAWYNISDIGNYVSALGGLHPGEDWNYTSGCADAGKEVYAAANGEILHIAPTWSSGYQSGGWTIVIKHTMISGEIYYSVYSHLTSHDEIDGNLSTTEAAFTVSEGDPIYRGTAIARIAKGNNGCPAGSSMTLIPTHLHFEMRDSRFDGNYSNLYLRDNGLGYYGGILCSGSSCNSGNYGSGMTSSEVDNAHTNMAMDGIIDASDFIDRNRFGKINSGDAIHAGSTSNPKEFEISFDFPHADFTLSNLVVFDGSQTSTLNIGTVSSSNNDNRHQFTASFSTNPSNLSDCDEYDIAFTITSNTSGAIFKAYGQDQVYFLDPTCVKYQFETNDISHHFNIIYARLAYLFGFTKGGSQTNFDVGNLNIISNLTKSDAIKLLYTLAKKSDLIDGINTDVSNGSYSDLSVCDEAFPFAQSLYNEGHIFDVLGNNELDPSAEMNFGEFSYWLTTLFNIQENCSDPDFNCQATSSYTCANPDWDNAITTMENAFFSFGDNIYSIGQLSRIDGTADCTDNIQLGDAYRLIIGVYIYDAIVNGSFQADDKEISRSMMNLDVSDWNVIGDQSRSTYSSEESPSEPQDFYLTIKDDATWTSGTGALQDSYGNDLHYYWSLIGGDLQSVLPDHNKVVFTPPDLDSTQTFKINVWLSNDVGNAAEGTFHITVLDADTDSTSLISRIEYFIDTDPGYGLANSIAFPPGAVEVDINTNIPLLGLTPGIHSLYIRSKNENEEWSLTQKRNFYLYDVPSGNNGELSRLEYFIDTDPGYGLANALPLSDNLDSQADYNIDLSTISPGIRSLYVRAQNNFGQWSLIHKRNIYVFDVPTPANGELERLEYFLDADPGYGMASELPLADPIDSQSDYNIDLSGVPAGIHSLYIRARNNYGHWSLVQKRNFYVYDAPGGEREIIEIEYFLDDDPGVGLATSISDGSIPGEDLDIDFVVADPNDNGNHIIYARALDNYGQWSFLARDTLTWSGNEIDILYPDGGQTFTAGTSSITNINWDTINNVNNVDIWLTEANGALVENIANNVDPMGPYAGSWAIPGYTNAGQYRILVEDRTNTTIRDYSTNTFTINNPSSSYCDQFTDLYVQGDVLDAANCLCTQNYITAQNHGASNTNGVQPEEDILRADLAKLVYYAIYQGDAPSPASNFPVPFLDLQTSADPYFKYAKALSYLQYDDDICPFDRDFVNFRPFEPIELKYAAKVIVEAFDFTVVQGDGGPVLNVNFGDDGYSYLLTLESVGFLDNVINTDANDFADRQDIFIILHNILNDCGSDCDETCHDPSPTESDYYNPGNLTPFNLSRSPGMNEGFFNDYAVTSYQIPGFKMSLNFSHHYHSHLAQLPEPFRPLEPLGTAWSHSYLSYITKISGWSADGQEVGDHWMIHWENGTQHIYSCQNNEPITHGVYDELNILDPNTIQVKNVNQIQFTFTAQSLSNGDVIYMLDEIKDRNNNTIDIVIENPGVPRIDQVIGTAGRILDFQYNNKNQLVAVNEPTGNRSIAFSIDSDWNLSSYTDPNNHTSQYIYLDTNDPSSNPKDHLLYEIIRPEGNHIKNSYSNGFLASQQIGAATPTTISVNTNYNNGSNDYQTQQIDPEGTVFDHTFNEQGYLESLVSSNTDITLSYGQAGDPSKVTSVTYEGEIRSVDYDNNNGKVKTITHPGGIVHQFTYNSLNDIASYTNPKSQTQTYNYDAIGNLDYATDAMNFVTDFTFDNKGMLTQIENEENIVQTFLYDNHGNMIESHSPLNISSHYFYDNIGRLDSMINPQLQKSSYEYDDLGLLEEQINYTNLYGNISTQYQYDLNNNLIQIINANAGVTQMTYDERDQIATSQFGDDVKGYSYYDDGLVDNYTKPDGYIFDHEYDDLGRLENDGYSSYSYDDRDNVTNITKNDSGFSIDYSYDVVNRVDTIWYDGEEIAYAYDLNNNLTKLTYPSGLEVDYTYDANNRMTGLSFNGNTITYSYLKDDRISNATLPNGTNREFGYDAAGRLTYMADLKSNGDTISAYHFTLDSLGNHRQEHINQPLVASPLNSLQWSFQHTTENEESTLGFAYDADGNRVDSPEQSANSVWDDRDMLLQHNGKNYAYDGAGLRHEINDNGVITKYIWDPTGIGKILVETSANGQPQYYYVYGMGLEARIDAKNNGVQYYHYDFRGSTVAITDETESITHEYAYLPFGSILDKQEQGAQPFKYVGRYGVMEDGNDLYYMRARYMDAQTGRFLSEDPVWAANLFPYADNNPITFIDPKGESSLYDKYHWGRTGFWLYVSGESPSYDLTHLMENNEIYDGNIIDHSTISIVDNHDIIKYTATVNSNNEYKALLGNFTVFYDENANPVGFYDCLNYDHKADQKWYSDRNKISAVLRLESSAYNILDALWGSDKVNNKGKNLYGGIIPENYFEKTSDYCEN